jgi:nucleotide-binding universal stress UspA family protein
LSQDLEADLIVIATHGRGGWQRFLFGSVAEKVVRLAPCPVLVVHAPQAEGGETAPQGLS